MKRLNYSLVCLLIAFQSVAQQATGPNNSYFLVADLQSEWSVFDPRYKAYVPFVEEQHRDFTAVSLLIDLESNRHYKLLLRVDKSNSLFINATFQQALPADDWLVLDIDSLYKKYAQPQLFLSVFGTPGVATKRAYIAHAKNANPISEILPADELLTVKPRFTAASGNFLILGLLVVLFYAAYLFNASRRGFERFFSIFDLLNTTQREESFLVNRPLSRNNLLFLALLSSLIAYVYVYYQSKNESFFYFKFITSQDQSMATVAGQYLLVAIIVFGLFVAKYVLLMALSGLFRLDKIVNVHYYKIVQTSLIFFSVYAIVLFSGGLYFQNWQSTPLNFIVWSFALFYLGRTLLLYFAINSTATVKNMFLIAYLCIAELIPLIVAIRIIT